MRTRSAICVLGLALALASSGSAQVLTRHVAEFRFGPEQFSFNVPPGDPIYLKTFNLPAGEDTIFVTLSTTGDTHGGAASWFSASVNGAFCNDGDDGAGFAPAGWIPLQKHANSAPGGDGGGGPGDMHDNGIYYTWCCRKGVQPGGPNRVEIRMATSIQNQFVFVERSHYYIDSAKGDLCNQADPIPGDAARREGAADVMPPGHLHPTAPTTKGYKPHH